MLILLGFTLLPCGAKTLPENDKDAPKQVFVYHIPSDEEETEVEESNIESPTEDITSDDVTADTSIQPAKEEDFDVDLDENYAIDDMYGDVLHGYATYDEDNAETISLEDDIKDFHELNIKTPSRIDAIKYNNFGGLSSIQPSLYTKFNGLEYSIKPVYTTHEKTIGNFSAGTIYTQGIDSAELEQSTGVYSRYDNKYFSITTRYSKTVNSIDNAYSDTLYLIPEQKLNQYFSIREVFSNNIATNRKKAEVYLSFKPFGFKDPDRMKFEIGASASYDDSYNVLKNQFKFLTRFKL